MLKTCCALCWSSRGSSLGSQKASKLVSLSFLTYLHRLKSSKGGIPCRNPSFKLASTNLAIDTPWEKALMERDYLPATLWMGLGLMQWGWWDCQATAGPLEVWPDSSAGASLSHAAREGRERGCHPARRGKRWVSLGRQPHRRRPWSRMSGWVGWLSTHGDNCASNRLHVKWNAPNHWIYQGLQTRTEWYPASSPGMGKANSRRCPLGKTQPENEILKKKRIYQPPHQFLLSNLRSYQ